MISHHRNLNLKNKCVHQLNLRPDGFKNGQTWEINNEKQFKKSNILITVIQIQQMNFYFDKLKLIYHVIRGNLLAIYKLR